MEVEVRVMSQADIPSAMRMTIEAGWNQTEADWQRLLAASPDGCFVAVLGGSVVGTVTTITYEKTLSWIGMVLVEQRYRRQGIGTTLLVKAIEYLERRGIPCMKLDATPAGKPLYETLGFREDYEIERWSLKRTGLQNSSRRSSPNIDSLLSLDRTVFGADRSNLLASLFDAAPHFTRIAGRNAAIEGYTFGRRGSLADHLGPWIARNERAASTLLHGFLETSDRELLFVDCVTSTPWARTIVKSGGFTFSRGLTRMYRGRNHNAGQLQLVGAILGPEFG